MKGFLLVASAAVAALALASPLQGQDDAAPPTVPAVPEGESNVLGYAPDLFHRMTVPVSIDGKGPYRFIVDTGAERTVISKELARALGLEPGRSAVVHSMTEVRETATVIIPELGISKMMVLDVHAPALARVNLGAEGMLGVDSLKSQRILFDFAKQEMTITPSRAPERRWSDDTIVVTARSRFGHLVLVDAAVEGQKVYVILDTGSQVSVANTALRRKLEKKKKLRFVKPIQLISVTGGTIQAEYTAVKTLRIGGIDINDMPLAFADVHPFRKLKLTDKPAILLGMDALRLFDRVSVDFATRKVRFLPPDLSRLGGETRVAGRMASRPRFPS